MAKIKVGNVKCSIIPFIDGSHIKYSDVVAMTPINIFIINNAQVIRGGGILSNAADGAGYKYTYAFDNANSKVIFNVINPQGASILSFYNYVYSTSSYLIVMFCQRESDGRLGICYGGGSLAWPWWPNGYFVNGQGSKTPGEYLYPNREPHIIIRGEQINVTTSDFSSIEYCSLSDNNQPQILNGINWFNEADSNAIKSGISTDESPYANGTVNKGKKGGETGKWVNPQPPTPVPSLPSNTILEAGLLNCYKVTFSDLERIASFMFDPSVANELMKVGTTLFDYMDGMYQVPVAVSTGANEVMALGNAFSGGGAIASSVSLPTVTEQYYEVDCGTVEVEEYWGNALDYSPYTKVTIMLPYIGAKELSADEVVGKTLHLKYHIDILSGACIAFLYESLTGGEQAVLYEFSGNCIMQLPLRQTDHSELIKGVLDTALAATAGAAVVGHGVAAVEAAGTAKQTAAAHITAEKQFASTESSAVTGIASNVTGAKVNVQRTGNLAGAQGFLGIQKPYLIIQRPTQAYPENMGHYKGFPCNQEARLGDLEGFTVVDSIRLNGLVGTEPEIAEIYDLLSKGVII